MGVACLAIPRHNRYRPDNRYIFTFVPQNLKKSLTRLAGEQSERPHNAGTGPLPARVPTTTNRCLSRSEASRRTPIVGTKCRVSREGYSRSQEHQGGSEHLRVLMGSTSLAPTDQSD